MRSRRGRGPTAPQNPLRSFKWLHSRLGFQVHWDDELVLVTGDHIERLGFWLSGSNGVVPPNRRMTSNASWPLLGCVSSVESASRVAPAVGRRVEDDFSGAQLASEK